MSVTDRAVEAATMYSGLYVAVGFIATIAYNLVDFYAAAILFLPLIAVFAERSRRYGKRTSREKIGFVTVLLVGPFGILLSLAADSYLDKNTLYLWD